MGSETVTHTGSLVSDDMFRSRCHRLKNRESVMCVCGALEEERIFTFVFPTCHSVFHSIPTYDFKI